MSKAQRVVMCSLAGAIFWTAGPAGAQQVVSTVAELKSAVTFRASSRHPAKSNRHHSGSAYGSVQKSMWKSSAYRESTPTGAVKDATSVWPVGPEQSMYMFWVAR